MGKPKITHHIIAPNGYIVCECESMLKAVRCRKELIDTDKSDGTYEKDFYKIVRV